jgi:NAD(P)-dependent dehydrogenase (short-subunit alcohol dehydrogenase family)
MIERAGVQLSFISYSYFLFVLHDRRNILRIIFDSVFPKRTGGEMKMDVRKLFSLEGRKGFITGGAQGIGKTIAHAYAELGADVAIVDMNMEKAEITANKIAEETGRKIIALQCNVTDPDSVNNMIRKYEAQFMTCDFAVNNAGIFTGDEAMEIDPKAFKSVIDVNLNGVFFTAQAAARLMKKHGTKGSIISTASMSAKIVNVPQTIANYCAAKAGVVHLTKALAVEWAKYNIRVNCVSPGYIQTELLATMTDMLPIWLAKMPEGSRLGFPEDLIGAFVYFASDASLFATGSDLAVDGGYTIL